jgi:hypothetical protein
MVIKDGEVVEANELLNNLVGDQFKNWMNLIWNSDYIGWNSKLNYDKEAGSGGTPGTSNLLWDNFTTTGAAERDKIGVETTYGLEYDATNDVYFTPDLSAVNSYVIIEATSLSAPWDSNNCKTLQIASGKWLVFDNTDDDIEIERAQIIKSLFYSGLIEDFTSITAVKTNTTRDVGSQAFYARIQGTDVAVFTHTGTFADTSTNDDCSSWAYIQVAGTGATVTGRWELPNGTPLLTVATGSSLSVDEMGTNTSGDETPNPANCALESANTANFGKSVDARVIVLCKGSITWVSGGGATGTDTDFKVDHSIPDMTLAGTLSAEGATTHQLISNDVATAVTNGIAVVNSTIDSANTQTLYLSADDGSNWEAATEKEIKRLSNAGSNFKFKWEVVRTDLSKEDNISAFGVLYSLGAGGG